MGLPGPFPAHGKTVMIPLRNRGIPSANHHRLMETNDAGQSPRFSGKRPLPR